MHGTDDSARTEQVTFAQHMTKCAADYLNACLEQTGGNVSAAAKLADMHRASFYRIRAAVAKHEVKQQPFKSAFTEWVTQPSHERRRRQRRRASGGG